MRKLAAALLTAVLLLGAAGSAAYAAEAPDLSREGSITLTMTYESKTVAGGEMTLYRVGGIVEENGSYRFALTDEFAASGVDITDVSSAETASALADYASAQGLAGTTKTIAGDGTVAFESLELGLYLLVQNKAADGYYAVSPFLVSVPMYNEANAAYEYAVTATPKVDLTKKSSSGGRSSHESSSSGGSSGSGGGSSSGGGPGTSEAGSDQGESLTPFDLSGPELFQLPQTGQLNWPVPVLTLSGVLLFALGWKLAFGGKRHFEEEA